MTCSLRRKVCVGFFVRRSMEKFSTFLAARRLGQAKIMRGGGGGGGREKEETAFLLLPSSPPSSTFSA